MLDDQGHGAAVEQAEVVELTPQQKMEELLGNLDEHIKNGKEEEAQKVIDQIKAGFDDRTLNKEDFYTKYGESANGLGGYPLLHALHEGQFDIFEYLVSNLKIDVSRALNGHHRSINVAQLPCQKDVSSGIISEMKYAIDDEKLKEAHRILDSVNEKLSWEQKRDMKFFTLANYFLHREIVEKMLELADYKSVVNEVTYREGMPVNYALSISNSDQRAFEISNMLLANKDVQHALVHGVKLGDGRMVKNRNFLPNAVDNLRFDIVIPYLDEHPEIIDELRAHIYLSLTGALNGIVNDNKVGHVGDFVKLWGLVLDKHLGDAPGQVLLSAHVTSLSYILFLCYKIEKKNSNSTGLTDILLEDCVKRIAPILKSDEAEIKDVGELSSLLAQNPALLLKYDIGTENRNEILPVFKEYDKLSATQRQLTDDLAQDNDPLMLELLNIVTDQVKLDDLVYKLDHNKEFRNAFRTLNHDTGGVFPLNVINDKLTERENSRGFFGNVFKALGDTFFPLKLSKEDLVFAAVTNPTTWASQRETVIAIQFEREQGLDFEAQIEAEDPFAGGRKTSREMYVAARRELIENRDSLGKEIYEQMMTELVNKGLEYERTLRKMQTTTKHCENSQKYLDKLNEAFMKALNNKDALLNLTDGVSKTIVEVRKEYLKGIYGDDVAKAIEEMYAIEGFSHNAIEQMQSALQNTFVSIKNNKTIGKIEKAKLMGVVLAVVDDIIAKPHEDVKANIKLIMDAAKPKDEIAISRADLDERLDRIGKLQGFDDKQVEQMQRALHNTCKFIVESKTLTKAEKEADLKVLIRNTDLMLDNPQNGGEGVKKNISAITSVTLTSDKRPKSHAARVEASSKNLDVAVSA